MSSSDATEGVQPDQYGQLHPIETPELIAHKLALLEQEINKIPIEKKTQLLQAQQKCPNLLTPEFKLIFLRSQVFNADLAAARYVSYWEKRVAVFGPDKAFQPLTMQNCLTDDMDTNCLDLQVFTPIQVGDRICMFMQPSNLDKTKYTIESFQRCFWYLMHCALEEEVVQKKGLIMLIFPKYVKLEQFDRNLAKEITRTVTGYLPLRLSAYHVCHPPKIFSIIFPIILLLMPDYLKKRIRLHRGSEERVLQRLESFGMPRKDLPTQLGGPVVLNLPAWLQKRHDSGL